MISLIDLLLLFADTHESYCVKCNQFRTSRTVRQVNEQNSKGPTKRIIGKCSECSATTSKFIRAN